MEIVMWRERKEPTSIKENINESEMCAFNLDTTYCSEARPVGELSFLSQYMVYSS